MSDLAHGDPVDDVPPPPARRRASRSRPPYNGRPPFVAGNATSEGAAAAIAPSAGSMRARVLRFITEAGDATCDEVEAGLGMRHQSASARVRELVLGGHLIRTERRRRTRSGCMAAVYVPR